MDSWNQSGKGGKDRPKNAMLSLEKHRESMGKTEMLLTTREVRS